MKEIELNGKKYVEKDNVIMHEQKDGMEYCIVRTYSAGVFAGWIDTKDKSMCQEVFEARRLWRWWSEFTLSALAMHGGKTGKEAENKYAMPVPRIILKEIIEIIPCTEKAKKYIVEKENYKEE